MRFFSPEKKNIFLFVESSQCSVSTVFMYLPFSHCLQCVCIQRTKF